MRLLSASAVLFLLCVLRCSQGAKKEKAERIKGGVQAPDNITTSAETPVLTLDIEHAFGVGTCVLARARVLPCIYGSHRAHTCITC